MSSVLQFRIRLLLLSLLATELWTVGNCRLAQKLSHNKAQALRLGRRHAGRRSLFSGGDPVWPVLPWQQPADWVLPYSAFVNDLPGLIGVQRRAGVRWLTMFALTRLNEHSYEGPIFLNTLTSYLLLGGGESYIVVVASEEALSACLRLRLPCFNASVDVQRGFLSSYTLGTWAKVLMTRLVLQALPSDLDLHLSDHDVIYLKRIVPTIERLAAGLDFDVLGQHEYHSINTGVVFLRNNPRVHDMYERWIRYISPDIHDQDTFHRLVGNLSVTHVVQQQGGSKGGGVQDGGGGSSSRNASSSALVVRHNVPWTDGYHCHWCPREYENCWEGDDPRHCDLRQRMYIHSICVADKARYIRGLGLWFLDRDDPRRVNATAIAAAGLPCAPPLDVAEFKVIDN